MRTIMLSLALLLTSIAVLPARDQSLGLGWAETNINSVIFRKNSVVSHGDIQYSAWYDSLGHVMLAKRMHGTDDWEVRRTVYTGNVRDAHNCISIMTDGDGYLHMSWDHHVDPLNYCRSVAPGSLELTGRLPMTGSLEQRVTYPEFYRMPNGDLLFFYRDGSSGKGDLVLNRYDTDTKTWTRVHDVLIDGEGERNAYWQFCIDSRGTLHLSWVWRETPDVATNHDICYARSRDSGLSWERSDGTPYDLPVTQATAEYVALIPQRSDLINQTSMAADADGRPYIATYFAPAGSNVVQYHMLYHDGSGWQKRQASQRTMVYTLREKGRKKTPFSRPQILIDEREKKQVYLIYKDHERGSRVTVSTSFGPAFEQWTRYDLTDFSLRRWEPTYDTERWRTHKELHLFLQKMGKGDWEAPVVLPPQPVYVREIPLAGPSAFENIRILRQNLIEDALQDHGFAPRTGRYIESDFSQASAYLESMQADGSWKDVDYTDRDNNWSPLRHLNKMLVMCIRYSDPGSPLYRDRGLHGGLEKAIAYWYAVNPECRNWYKNRIAKQFYFNVIALLLQGEIDPDLHARMVNDLTAAPSMTGSNRTLVAISTFYRGVIENNPARIQMGVEGVTDQIKITEKEGVQPDYSFHQHGPFIYNGSYGSNFLRESVWMASIVHGTSYAYSDEQIGILRNYYLEGTRWMIRGKLLDFNVRGRQVGRDSGLDPYARVVIPQLEHFMIIDPDHRRAYETSKQRIEQGKPQAIRGHKHFWRSDYTVHHRPAYFTSLKMCSERTVGMELNMNSENKLGYWLPYGLTYICREGDEYTGIFPVWDWALLPGVTCPHAVSAETRRGTKHTQQTSFVGGVSDGQYGVSAMDFDKDGTQARKAWFWFDQEWVALGAGIRSEHAENIVTGINQTLLDGEIFADGKRFKGGSRKLKGPGWVLHDSVGYVFPGKGPVRIRADVRKGNMQRIYGLGNDSVHAHEVFSLWFDHGQRPSDASYAYIVVPGTGAADLKQYAKELPVSLLSNTPALQAVRHEALRQTGIVFHEAGMFRIHETLSVGTDQPCIMLVDEAGKSISISEPTAKLKTLRLRIERGIDEPESILVNLPSGGQAGRSVTLVLR